MGERVRVVVVDDQYLARGFFRLQFQAVFIPALFAAAFECPAADSGSDGDLI